MSETRLIPDNLYLDSKVLASLRIFLELYPELEKLTGKIAQYKIVIDANAAISDLLHKHRNPHLKQTAIEEAAKSSAVELHAPTWLNTEMVESAIPQVSKRKKIPEPELLELWTAYKEQIIWDDTFSAPEAPEHGKGDSKDVPYVALQQSIAAAAILSQDTDIDELGGKRATLEFVLSVRSYARAASYTVAIRVGGTFITTVSIALMIGIVKGLGSLIAKLPDWLKIALLVLAVVAIVHPEYRERLVRFLKNMGGQLADFWPEIEKLIELDSAKQLEAEAALGETERLIGS